MKIVSYAIGLIFIILLVACTSMPPGVIIGESNPRGGQPRFSATFPLVAEVQASLTIVETVKNASGQLTTTVRQGTYLQDRYRRVRIDVDGVTTIEDPIAGFRWTYGVNVEPVKRRFVQYVVDPRGFLRISEESEREMWEAREEYRKKNPAQVAKQRQQAMERATNTSLDFEFISKALKQKLFGISPAPGGGTSKTLGTKKIEGYEAHGTRTNSSYSSASGSGNSSGPMAPESEIWFSEEILRPLESYWKNSDGNQHARSLRHIKPYNAHPNYFAPPQGIQWIEKSLTEP